MLTGLAPSLRRRRVFDALLMGVIRAKLGRISDEARSKQTEKHLLYFPSASRGVAALSSELNGVGSEIEKLLITQQPKGTMTAHGYRVQYDRKEVIAMRANSAMSIAADIQKELELTDHKALEQVLGLLAKLQIPVNPLVSKKLSLLGK